MALTVFSGGQTGVDRAALDAARVLGIPINGWCPRGRKAEDGLIPHEYRLKETPSDQYSQRTRWNVRDSDGTLLLVFGVPTGGTALTIKCAARSKKPYLVLDLNADSSAAVAQATKWIEQYAICTLNVAGPRGGHEPEAYTRSLAFLGQLFRSISDIREFDGGNKS